ncbi:Outer membrane cobalamin receptor protein, SusC/RagA family [Bacteroidales bacterium Barb6]|nr:Outer membrane cobalamin receptor protein, SusC/RagA family [Bacteroidales bacterium Barb6]
MTKLSGLIRNTGRLWYSALTLFIFYGSILSANAQGDIVIHGKIIDESTDETVIGATVSLKDARINSGTVTDLDGTFRLSVSSLPVTIAVSYIGYRTQEITVYDNPAETIIISLAENVNTLNEVVVVGYGTQRKITVTNSISQISGTDLADRPVSNIQQSLQGKLPGVTVSDLGGSPGRTSTNIRIRGITSFNTSKTNGRSGYDLSKNNALIIVDGIEQDLSNINPDDIETISVLKDASSTAIYGSRGTNGVILVTTKKAKSGKIQVDVNSYVGWQQSNNTPEPMGLEAYMKEQQWAYKNANTNPFPERYTDESIKTWVNATDREKYPLPNTWFQTLLHTAPQYNTSVSVSGGTDIVRSRLSIRYFDQQGVIGNNENNLLEGKLNTDFTLSPTIKVNTTLDYRNNNYKYPTIDADNPTNRFLHGTLWAVPKYDDGTYGLSTQAANPLMDIEKGGLSNTKRDYFTGNINAEWEIIKGLSLSTQLGLIHAATYQKNYINSYVNTDKNTGITKTVANNTLNEIRNNEREYTWNNLLTYKKNIKKHDFSALLGYSQIGNTRTYLSAYRERFYNNDISSIGQGANDGTKSNDGRDEEYGLRSYFGRINYGYAGKYLLEANGRYDGSSKFTGDKQYGIFPSFSAGWVISEEAFWESLRSTVNMLKLRGSWGITGNQSVDLYSYYASLVSRGYNFGGSSVSGYRQTALANTGLGWESTTQTDIGFESVLFNKLEVTVDYYKKTTDDILLNLDIPATIGLTAPPQNAGSVENKGWELSANFRNKTSYGLGYVIGGNFNINNNKVTDLKGTGPYFLGDHSIDPYYTIAQGLPINTLWGYKTDGLFQSLEEIEAYRGGAGRHPFNQANPQPGDVKYLDLSGNGTIDAEDMRELGHSFPKYTFGFNLELSYRNFELSALFQGAADVDVRLSGALAEMGNQEGFAHKIYENNYWTPDNTNARFPRPVKYDLKNVASSDRMIIDASYLRLKNLQLAYNVPVRSLLNATKIKKLRVYAVATNLLTFSKLNEWNLDPEAESGRAIYYPQTSLYTFGVNLQF